MTAVMLVECNVQCSKGWVIDEWRPIYKESIRQHLLPVTAILASFATQAFLVLAATAERWQQLREDGNNWEQMLLGFSNRRVTLLGLRS
ncbi:hypothetical protein Y032_0018g3678 [Ancylostoma ceylanicum]|uniref:Uncharacterized protein n=1 Tax=Ancylostoma ceylanicum TaxID=53326 RepID=A0A016V4Z8_9BILA|nr:hypothetical protein Y032_0018g3678 [Ancylostoma ceylanicum]